MKSIVTTLRTILVFSVSLISISAIAQTPGGINYQGVARNQFLVGLNNDSIQLRFTVKEKTANGNSLYTETRGTRTDSFGVFNVVIGAAGAISQSGNIKLVPWSDTTKKFLMVEMNILDPNTPGFLNMGTTQLLSVPFSFYSDISDSTRIAAKADSAKFAAKADSAKFATGSGRYFFSATIPADTYQPIPSGIIVTVKVPTVLQNEGNVYDAVNSIFTAPDSGIYHFNITGAHLLETNQITTPGNAWSEDAKVALMKNGQLVKLLHEERHSYTPPAGIVPAKYEDYGISYFNSQANVKLAKNDQVKVVLLVTYSNFTNYKLGWSSADGFGIETPSLYGEFSGYRIK